MQQAFSMESRGNQLPGERFCPMEDELILFYLKPMLSGERVPGRNKVVFDCDLYGHQEPWEIWEAYKSKRPNDLRLNKDLYFFTQHKKMSSTDKRIRRTVGSGTWHGNIGKPVKSLETGHVVGSKKVFSYENKASVHHGCWILYEFYLDRSLRDKKQKVDDYVLCLLRKNGDPKSKIQKKRKLLEEEEVLESTYTCDDGEHSNTEQEEFLGPQAKRRETMSSVDSTPVPLPTPSEEDAFLAQLEETLECSEDDHSPSSEAEALQRFALEVQPDPFFGDDHMMQLMGAEALGEVVLYGGNCSDSMLGEVHRRFASEVQPYPLFDGDDHMVQQMGALGEIDLYGGNYSDSMMMDEALHRFPSEVKSDPLIGDDHMVQQMGAEALGEVDPYGGICSDSMLDEMLMSFAEELTNDGQPFAMEVLGEWNAGYSNFEYAAV
ncbi:NAC domain-containing protein 2-like [Argentina anserina]|uniref:NAC domain-containing protein 2-like n=1 Tax=Argentina anserina TaxID=57926 RepID=UPI00217623F2|nr:NAC domain-containing protein 2-like [Potentilla anserina]